MVSPLVFLTSIFLFHSLTPNEGELWYHTTLRRVFMVSPLVFLIWFFANRYSQLARLKEKYTFKYTTAMAFEGYKKQIEDLDLSEDEDSGEKEELLKKLLETSIAIFSDDPTTAKGKEEFLKKRDISSIIKRLLESIPQLKNAGS